MWGVIPAAGSGSRIQPLAFSKELLPVGSRIENGIERPRAVSEYLIDRMILGGATRICFVISPGKSDILEYYGGGLSTAQVAFVVQPAPSGLCDAIFRALAVTAPHEPVLVGLPDTIWFPEDGFCALPDGVLSFLMFHVEHPDLFDAVIADSLGNILEIQVKSKEARSNWIWGAFKMPGSVLADLHQLWVERDRQDEYIGTLINAYLNGGGRALGVRGGDAYVDVGTIGGYRQAMHLLSKLSARGNAAPATELSQW